MGDDDPGLGGGNGFLKVLGKPSASAKPCEGALDDPPAWKTFEAFGLVRPFDDFLRSFADRLQPAFQLVTRIAAISKDMKKPRPAMFDRLEKVGRTIAVLDIGAMDHEANHQAGCIDDYVALAALDLFARIIAANTAAFGGLTLWLSITPAEGEASRPSSSRVSMTR